MEFKDDRIVYHVKLAAFNTIRAQRFIVGTSSSCSVSFSVGDQAVIAHSYSLSSKDLSALGLRFMCLYTAKSVNHPDYVLKTDSGKTTPKGNPVHRLRMFVYFNYSIVNFSNNVTIK